MTTAAAPDTGPVVILIGPPGAGKTTVGRALAERLGVAFRDTDADVVRTTGREIADIFTKSGEAAFRSLEREAVAAAVAEHEGVLALGGGAVMDPSTQQVLTGQRVVFLSISMPVGVRRTGMSQQRPMFVGVNARGTFKALLEQRLPIYRSLATMEIDADRMTVDEIVERIVVEFGAGRSQ